MSAQLSTALHSGTHRLARLVTELFAPAVFAAVMPLIIAIHVADTWIAGMAWGCLAVVFSSLIPYGVIWLGVRRGRLTDHHIGVRQQRRTPLLFGLASVITGLTLLVLLDAPRQLTAMVTVMLAVLLGVAVVNQMWKLSAHAAVSAGSVTVLVMVFGPRLLPAAVLVALVGWSRVQLRDHITSQVIAGALAGTVLSAATFSLVA